jgi:2-polyprenyl-3-methyl-5-hydroxy-6-metoxy-1,4-benzoquinol methylase
MADPLCAQGVWDRSYEQHTLAAAGPDDPLRRWIESRFRGRSGSCLELGCFPGRFLAVFGELGFELHGVDLTPRTETELAPWLAGRGHRIGKFVRADFFQHRYERQYDVVCSFGVIEHFPDWPAFLAHQASLVAPGGCIVVSAPNFRGWVQRGLHRFLDRPNYERHCLDAMRPAAWAAQLAAQGWTVLEHGGLGTFEYWVDPGPRTRLVRAGLWLAAELRGPATRYLPADAPWCSPYLRLIARRPA